MSHHARKTPEINRTKAVRIFQNTIPPLVLANDYPPPSEDAGSAFPGIMLPLKFSLIFPSIGISTGLDPGKRMLYSLTDSRPEIEQEGTGAT
jgi:hypothetical protein